MAFTEPSQLVSAWNAIGSIVVVPRAVRKLLNEIGSVTAGSDDLMVARAANVCVASTLQVMVQAGEVNGAEVL